MTNQCQHGQLARVCQICEQAAEIADLRAQVAALEVDAGRYRHLRSSDWECFDYEWLREMDMPSDTGISHVVHEKALDTAIDAALAARKGG